MFGWQSKCCGFKSRRVHPGNLNKMVHTHESLCLTAEVFIVYKDKVLLRKHDKYNKWLGVGGHIDPGEDPTQTAVREAKEEVGLEVILADKGLRNSNIISPIYSDRHRVSPTHEHFTLIYMGMASTDKIKDEGREKSNGCKWFTWEELESEQYEIQENIRMYAKTALTELVK